jgi:hypothetical protein
MRDASVAMIGVFEYRFFSSTIVLSEVLHW